MPRKRTTRVFWRGARGLGGLPGLRGRRRRPGASGRPWRVLRDRGHGTLATKLANERVPEAEGARGAAGRRAGTGGGTLGGYGSEPEKRKQEEGTAPRQLIMVAGQLKTAIAHFGAERELSTITTRDVARWVRVLRRTPNGRGGTFSDATVRKYLNALSDLFARAVSFDQAPTNPELGHQSSSMIEERYGHLARVTERSEVVEFQAPPPHHAAQSVPAPPFERT